MTVLFGLLVGHFFGLVPVEVAVADTGNDKFVLIDGTATGVNDEIDLSTDASSWAKVVCLEANTWYVVAGVGVTTDGGVAD